MKKLILRLKATWVKLFGPDKKLINEVKKVLAVVQAIKRVVDNPAVDALTKLIPGTADDAIVAAVRRALEKILQVQNVLSHLPAAMPANAELRNAIYAKAASMAVMELHWNTLTESEADTLVNIIYNQEKQTL